MPVARLGRPPKPPEQIRTTAVTVLLTKLEARHLERTAAAAEKSLSGWIRDLIVKALVAEQIKAK